VEGSSVHRNLQQITQTTVLVYWYNEYSVHIFVCSILYLSSPFRFSKRRRIVD